MDNDHEEFSGKTAVVTGASTGIGFGLSKRLLERGANVWLCSRTPANVEAAQIKLNEFKGRAHFDVIDVRDAEQVSNYLNSIAKQGRIDYLFNNAGVGYKGVFTDATPEMWEFVMSANLYGVVNGMTAAVPIMLRQGGGQIINIISGTAFMPMAQWSPYATTKAALNALTVAVRSEYWDDNIKISSATPGTTATNIFGDKKPAEGSMQTPQQSATRILKGVVNNDRIIYGDDADVRGSRNCFAYRAQKGQDAYLLRVARERRKGITAI